MNPLVTPQEVRDRWCFGLPLNKEDGAVMTDDDLLAFIDSATAETERKIGVYLTPKRIVSCPDVRGLKKRIDYDIEEPAYDYDVRQYNSWGFIQLRHNPIISVSKVMMVLPNGQKVVDFPMEWVKVYKKSGQINIVPYAGSPMVMTIAGGSGSSYPLLSGQFARNFPQAFYIDYVAGIEEVSQDIKEVIAKLAAIDVLGISGDAILAGIASLSTSVDGMSQSFSTTASATNATYGSRILQYQQEVNAFFLEGGQAKGEHSPTAGSARSYYKGFTFDVL
jgi:hypothetical protein